MNLQAWLDETVYRHPPESNSPPIATNRCRQQHAPRGKSRKIGSKAIILPSRVPSTTSYLQPVCDDPASNKHDLSIPYLEQHRLQQEISRRVVPHRQAPSSSPGTASDVKLCTRDDPYRRKPRRATRPDCYEVKPRKEQARAKQKRGHRRRSRQEQREHVDKSADRTKTSLALKGQSGKSRLTLRPTDHLSLFRHGKASNNAVDRQGVPDLSFNDLSFLNKQIGPRETIQDHRVVEFSKKINPEDEHIAKYFDQAERARQESMHRDGARPEHAERQLSIADYLPVHQSRSPSSLPQMFDTAATVVEQLDMPALETTPARQYRLRQHEQRHTTKSREPPIELPFCTAARQDVDDCAELIIGSKRSRPISDVPLADYRTSDILDVFSRTHHEKQPSSNHYASGDHVIAPPPAHLASGQSFLRKLSSISVLTDKSPPPEHDRQTGTHKMQRAITPAQQYGLPVRAIKPFRRDSSTHQSTQDAGLRLSVSRFQLWRSAPIAGSSAHQEQEHDTYRAYPKSKDELLGIRVQGTLSTSFDMPSENGTIETTTECGIDDLWWRVRQHKRPSSKQFEGSHHTYGHDVASREMEAGLNEVESNISFWRPNRLY